MRNLLILLCLISSISLSCENRKSDITEPLELKCEYSDFPQGIGNINPRLSWILSSDKRNQKQNAYRILVASSKEILDKNIGDLWDSGKVISDESVHILYKGRELHSGMRCWWKVCVWDQKNRKSDWSKTAAWEMGLLKPEDWKAEWITCESSSGPLDRKSVV